MQKTLTKHGNSYALIIEKPILDLLGATTSTSFEVTTDGQALVLTPLREEERKIRFHSALAQVNRKYSRALKKMAD